MRRVRCRWQGVSRPAAPGEERQQAGQGAESEPCLRQALPQQQRHQRPRCGDAEPDPHENEAAGKAATRCGDERQNRRRGQHHQRPAAEARDKPPDKKPEKRNGMRAGEEGRCRERHRQPQDERRGKARGERPAEQGAGEIAGEIGGAEIGCRRGREPMRPDDRRQERRIGEARQPDANEAGAKGRYCRPPRHSARRAALFAAGRCSVHRVL